MSEETPDVKIPKGFEDVPFEDRKGFNDLTPGQQAEYKGRQEKVTQSLVKLRKTEQDYDDYDAYWGRSVYWAPLIVRGVSHGVANKKLERYQRKVGYNPSLVEPLSSEWVKPTDRAKEARSKYESEQRGVASAIANKGKKLYFSDRLKPLIGKETALEQYAREKQERTKVAEEEAGTYVDQHPDIITQAKREMEDHLKMEGRLEMEEGDNRDILYRHADEVIAKKNLVALEKRSRGEAVNKMAA